MKGDSSIVAMVRNNRNKPKTFALKLTVSALMALAVSFFPYPLTADQQIPYGVSDIVDITYLNHRILVHLVYSTPDNFLRDDFYGDLDACYLRREVAEMLSRAQDALERRKKGLRLMVYDGLRPRTIQYEMWRMVKGTLQQPYVAEPERGSVHNYGAAVDLTIADETGAPLNMGTPFDSFGEASQPRYEKKMLKQGRLTRGQIANRELLRSVMKEAGFIGLADEWWHFEACDLETAVKRYPAVEFFMPEEHALDLLRQAAALPRDAHGYCLLVKGSQKKICLIKDDVIELVFDAALGAGGLGKMREGDYKTPLGDYRIKWMVSTRGPRKENPGGVGSFIVDGKTYAVLDTELFFGDPTTITVETLPDGTRRVSENVLDRSITPEEIAIAQSEKLWTDAYGGKDAYVMALDYPNAMDRAEGKTGSCIEIHASVNLDRVGYRNYGGTQGCVALYPAFARRIYERVNPGTAVRIVE
jgi:D-alanyl-D-alanine dipeptidase